MKSYEKSGNLCKFDCRSFLSNKLDIEFNVQGMRIFIKNNTLLSQLLHIIRKINIVKINKIFFIKKIIIIF